jgi:hypothetical protein
MFSTIGFWLHGLESMTIQFIGVVCSLVFISVFLQGQIILPYDKLPVKTLNHVKNRTDLKFFLHIDNS